MQSLLSGQTTEPACGHSRQRRVLPLSGFLVALAALAATPLCSLGQSPAAPAQLAGNNAQSDAKPLSITLAEALERAKKLSPALETALSNVKIAAAATTQARAANLPNVNGISQYLYTEGNGTPAARFIANNGVHEYIAQTDVHQAISGPTMMEFRRSLLLKAAARDQATIAERGLLVTVVQAYANLVAAYAKTTTAHATLDAAKNFLTVTEQREQNGEAAHADVLKARIQEADSEVALDSARQVQEQARLSLALLIFNDVNQRFTLADDPGATLVLAPYDQVEAEAAHGNPALDAAVKTEQAAQKAVVGARMGYLPSLSFDYYYGIDANQFASRTTLPDGKNIQNLGYSALASLNVPIFQWGSIHSRLKDAEARQQDAKMQLSYARRQAVADLEQFYHAAQVAQQEVGIRRQALNDAMESRKLTLLQYKAGMATALEVVSAESIVDVEGSAFADAKTRYATALANLATLTGVL